MERIPNSKCKESLRRRFAVGLDFGALSDVSRFGVGDARSAELTGSTGEYTAEETTCEKKHFYYFI